MAAAANMSSLLKATNFDHSETAKSRDVITRDFFGGSFNNDNQELDIDMEVPPGWEKYLDLKSGRVYMKRCNNTTSIAPSSSLDKRLQTNQAVPKLHDLSFPISTRKPLLSLLDDTDLELKLTSKSSSYPPCPQNYQSICTLDKVKSALENAEKKQNKKRSSSPSHSSSSLSIQDVHENCDPDDSEGLCFPVALGCPRCLYYVLVSRSDPRCPQCNSAVPLPTPKKPRLDLNISI